VFTPKDFRIEDILKRITSIIKDSVWAKKNSWISYRPFKANK
jgi:hypothetical protein